MLLRHCLFTIFLVLILYASAPASEQPEFEIEIEDDGATPTIITVPANIKIVLEIENETDSTVKFYIPELHVRISVPADDERELFIGPLDAGEYSTENLLNDSKLTTIIAK